MEPSLHVIVDFTSSWFFMCFWKSWTFYMKGGSNIFFTRPRGGSDIFFTCLRGGSSIFFNIFGISPIQSFSFYCYAPYHIDKNGHITMILVVRSFKYERFCAKIIVIWLFYRQYHCKIGGNMSTTQIKIYVISVIMIWPLRSLNTEIIVIWPLRSLHTQIICIWPLISL